MSYLASWLLNLVYFAVIALCAPWILWAAVRTGKYREGFREKFLGLVPRREGDGTCVWIHAVSVGEVNLLATTIRELMQAHPDWQVVVSTTSKAGYELARKKYPELVVFYCPLDFSWAVRRAMRRVRPTMLVLAELELWPNLILAAKNHGARVAIINGRLSDKSFPGYWRIRPLVSRVLARLDLIATQNEETAERFRLLGAPSERVHVTGSLKYDGAQTDRDNPRTVALRQLAGIAEDDIVFLTGSTQEPEEEIAIDIYRKLVTTHPRLRLVLVPRHPERFDTVAKLVAESNLPWKRRSELTADSREPTARRGSGEGAASIVTQAQQQRPNSATGSSRAPSRSRPPLRGGARLLDTSHPTLNIGHPILAQCRPILLVDTVGELEAWWGTATIAFVGGSFGSRGGQNMIEPAAYGAAVSFGPNTWNFRDIVAALGAAGGAVVVTDAPALEAFVRRCLEEPAFAAALGERAQALVRSQLGATRRTVELLESVFATAPNAEDKLADRSAA